MKGLPLSSLTTVAEKGEAIDLVLLDMVMPGMDGGQTFDRIREIQPQLPVLLSSGYAINGKALEIINRGCNGFIQKPFSMSELSKKVRKVLFLKKFGKFWRRLKVPIKTNYLISNLGVKKISTIPLLGMKLLKIEC